jgi:hypothetical protein
VVTPTQRQALIDLLAQTEVSRTVLGEPRLLRRCDAVALVDGPLAFVIEYVEAGEAIDFDGLTLEGQRFTAAGAALDPAWLGEP